MLPLVSQMMPATSGFRTGRPSPIMFGLVIFLSNVLFLKILLTLPLKISWMIPTPEDTSVIGRKQVIPLP
jgi:hypothetical protein